MVYLVRRYLGFGYGLVQGQVSSGPAVLNCQHQESKAHTLRLQDQAKQVAHSGPPHLALAFSRSGHSTHRTSSKKNNQGNSNDSHVPQADPSAAGFAQLESEVR
jgi:hypothetical protein